MASLASYLGFQPTANFHLGGIVVRILHYEHQIHDGCIFVAIRLFGEKAAWVHQAQNSEQFNLLYMICLAHHEKQTSCT